MKSLRVLVLGGYGVFGGRLIQLLSDESRLNLIVAGRSRAKAIDFCTRLEEQAKATITPLMFDRNLSPIDQLWPQNPDVLIDASGPYQIYGEDPYRLVRACIDLGITYLDFADASEFVSNVSTFDAIAKQKGVCIRSGVSSFPVLTAAVLRKLTSGLAPDFTVRGGIAPSPYAGVGLNVIKAITSYAGKPLSLVRNAKKIETFGLTETTSYTIAPPGYTPLRRRLFSLVDVPDLQVLPNLWPGLRTVWMGAGPVPEVYHRMLIGLAWLVRLRLLPSLRPLAWLFHQVINHFRWGDDRGGMFIEVVGKTETGATETRSWHMVAEGEDGPFIPSMALEILIRRILDGKPLEPGARSAATEIELDAYQKLFENRRIYSGFRIQNSATVNQPLYQQTLGDQWPKLPHSLREMHNLKDRLTAQGTARVVRGKSLLSRVVAGILGFPNAGEQVPVTVSFEKQGDQELWTRNFAGKEFQSIQRLHKTKRDGLIHEQFGPVSVGLAMLIESDRIKIVVRSWRLFGIPMPLILAPGGEASEFESHGLFHFSVEIKAIFTGLIVQYQGCLEIIEAGSHKIKEVPDKRNLTQ